MGAHPSIEAVFQQYPILDKVEDEIYDAWYGGEIGDCDQYIKSAVNADTAEMRLSSLDMFFGNVGVIDSVWFFERTVDSAAFQRSLTTFLGLYPELCGRLRREHDRYVLVLNNEGVAYSERRARGSALNYSQEEPRRGIFTDIRPTEDILTGKAPIMSVVLTQFLDKSSAVGISISHCLVDTVTFYNLAAEWAEGHTKGFASQPKYSFKRSLISLPQVYAEKGPQEAFLNPLQRSTDDSYFKKVDAEIGRKRARVHFKREDLARIQKETVWEDDVVLSTNDMLLARICTVLGRTILGLSSRTSDSKEPGARGTCQVRAHVNLRGSAVPENYAGNGFSSCSGSATIELADLCNCFATIGSEFRSPEAASAATGAILRKWAVLEHGETTAYKTLWGQSSDGGVLFVTNSLHRIPMRSVKFGTNNLVAFVPQTCGDAILIIPAKDGVFAYINPHVWVLKNEGMWQRLLRIVESNDFKKQVLELTDAAQQASMVYAPGNGKNHGIFPLNSVDAFFGLHAIVDSVWYFDKPLDAKELRETLANLLGLYPMLSGRVRREKDRFVIELCNQGVPLSEKKRPGSAKEYVETEPSRGLLVDIRDARAVMSDNAPIMTVLVTNFEDGTSALGVAISHALVDGVSFHNLVAAWAEGHRKGFTAEKRYQLSRDLIPLPKVVKLPDPKKAPLNLFQRSKDDAHFKVAQQEMGEKRARIRFSAKELEVFKATTTSSGDIPPSTNDALLARICMVLGLRTCGAKVGRECQVLACVDLHGRGMPSNYIGNAFVSLSHQSSLQLRNLCRTFYDISSQFRNRETVSAASESVLKRLALLEAGRESVAQIYYGESVSGNISFSTNSLHRACCKQVTFGGGKLLGFTPQTLADAILVVPDVTGDGVLVYINPYPWIGKDEEESRHAAVSFIESSEFKAELLSVQPQFTKQDTILSPLVVERSIPINRLDQFWGRSTVVETTWLFSGSLDGDAMRASLQKFLGLYPELAGRIRSKDASYFLETCNQGVSFFEQESSGSVRDHLEEEPQRGRFTDLREPLRIMSGDEPVMTVLITRFEDGSSALGIGMWHGIVDGGSFYNLIHAWADGHRNGFPADPKYSFSKELLTFPKLDSREKPKEPVDISSDQKLATANRKNQGQPRARVKFSDAEMASLKKSTPCSGGKTPSSMEALLARIYVVLGQRSRSKTFKVFGNRGLPCNIPVFANLRGRGISEKFLGNAIYIGSVQSNLNLEMVCGAFKALFDQMRSSDGCADVMQKWAESEADWVPHSARLFVRHYFPPGTPEFLVNNQRAFRQSDVCFGAGELLDLWPQNSGDSIYICAAKDGVSVHLPTDTYLSNDKAAAQELLSFLKTKEFKDDVLRFQITENGETFHTETVLSASTNSRAIELSSLDVFSGFNIVDAVWFFEKAPALDAIRASLTTFLGLYPELCGRIRLRDPEHYELVLNNEGVALSAKRWNGSAMDYASAEPTRGQFTDMRHPDVVMGGKAPVMTVLLTYFSDGSGAIGIAITGALVGAPSLFRLVALWADGHANGFPKAPEFSFDRRLLVLPGLDPAELPEVPLKLAKRVEDGNPGLQLGRWIRAQCGRRRVCIHFSNSELDDMQAKTARTVGSSLTKEEVLSARVLFTCLVKLIAATKGKAVQIAESMHVGPDRFMGNTIVPCFYKSKLSVADLYTDIANFHKPFRDLSTRADAQAPVLKRLAEIECGVHPCMDNLVTRGAMEALMAMMPQLLYTSHVSSPICSVRFGTGKLVAFAPPTREESVLFIPDPDGIKVYINPHSWMIGMEDTAWLEVLATLGSKEFKDSILSL